MATWSSLEKGYVRGGGESGGKVQSVGTARSMIPALHVTIGAMVEFRAGTVPTGPNNEVGRTV
jgi:hypothetical protein